MRINRIFSFFLKIYMPPENPWRFWLWIVSVSIFLACVFGAIAKSIVVDSWLGNKLPLISISGDVISNSFSEKSYAKGRRWEYPSFIVFSDGQKYVISLDGIDVNTAEYHGNLAALRDIRVHQKVHVNCIESGINTKCWLVELCVQSACSIVRNQMRVLEAAKKFKDNFFYEIKGLLVFSFFLLVLPILIWIAEV